MGSIVSSTFSGSSNPNNTAGAMDAVDMEEDDFYQDGRKRPPVLESHWNEDFSEEAMQRVTGADGVNGLFHRKKEKSCIVPEEIMEIILSYCGIEDILKISKVCVRWKTIATSRSFWKLVLARYLINLNTIPIPSALKENPSAWIAYFAFCKNKVLTKNFVTNHSGQDGFRGWHLHPPADHGQAFQIEQVPIGCDRLPDDPEFDTSSCFVSSYSYATKYQSVDLWKAGLTPAVMKICTPFEFTLTTMVGARFDCGVMGTVNLHIDADVDNANFDIRPRNENGRFNMPPGSNWQAIELKLKVDKDMLDGTDLRYLIVLEGGKDTQFWAGYYGPKFARTCIKFKCLEEESEIVDASDNE